MVSANRNAVRMLRHPAECNSAIQQVEKLLPRLRRLLGVFQFLFAAPVAALLDGSAGAFEFLFGVPHSTLNIRRRWMSARRSDMGDLLNLFKCPLASTGNLSRAEPLGEVEHVEVCYGSAVFPWLDP